MNLIDRDSLLEKFQFRIEPHGLEGATTKWCVEKAREIILAEPVAYNLSPTEWIPVTERLPQDRGDVLIVVYWHESWRTMTGWYGELSNNWRVITPNGEHKTAHVTHWMPLPEPPKGVE